MVSDPTHHFTAALQILPEYFEYFNSNQTHHSRFSIEKFYITMFHMELRGYSSMLFILIQAINKISLAFENPQSHLEPKVLLRELDASPSEGEQIAQVDYGTFVSIDSQDFKRVVHELNAPSVNVSLTASQIKFMVPRKEIVLTRRERGCITGGIPAGETFRFSITLHPLLFFHDLSHKSKRAWLFMSVDYCTVIIFPFGIFTQFWVYFPR
ncbi:uncharacterized protein LOC111498890 [Cucurbita maxima]|uniref:Uncharacterized protein LOC111498890 n=1 Tax=Cucurbita maxima TaxID=3661 RepID=A0A6J1L3R9_CUCMA|nr:uncharacterized protein LOC111498890 [Cucurbita maxima]